MKSVPRILPLIGVAVAGVLAINALSGAQSLPDMILGARAFAEDIGKPEKPTKTKVSEGEAPKAELAATGTEANAVAVIPAIKPPAVCAPTAAELAKEAGLSPAELQVLQSLGARRGQLDQREQDMGVQLALLAAAEAKLDARIKTLDGLKGDIKGLLDQTDAKEQAEVDRLVKVYEGMKPKDAAPRMVLLDDPVRLPIAAKMKERALSAILAQMPPTEAKRLTESLSRRFAQARQAADQASTAAAPSPAAKPVKQAAGTPNAQGATAAKPKA